MSTELLAPGPGAVELGHGRRITEAGLVLPPGLAWNEWVEVGRALAEVARRTEHIRSRVSWAIGQWLLYGEHAYGEKFAQAASELGLEPHTLQNMQWVVERFGGAPSHPSLGFWHHAEVAALPPEDREAILKVAEAERLSRSQVRELARDARASAAGEDPDELRAKDALEHALAELRRLPPERWADLVFWAIQPMLRAPGFRQSLELLLQESTQEVEGDND